MTETTIYFTEGADGLSGGERLIVVGEDAPVIRDVLAELARARAKFPDQHIPDGTGGPVAVAVGGLLKALCQANGPAQDTWMNVVAEEVGEAFAETDWSLLRPELVQCGAMFARWILDGDARVDHGLRPEFVQQVCEFVEGNDETLRRMANGPYVLVDQNGTAIGEIPGQLTLFDAADEVPCALRNEIHGPHGDCRGIDDPDVPNMRYPSGRPGWLGEYQKWPCGRCGVEHDDSDQHDCQPINKDGSSATLTDDGPAH